MEKKGTRAKEPSSVEGKIAQNLAFRIFASLLGAFLFFGGLWQYIGNGNSSAIFLIIMGGGLLFEFGIRDLTQSKKQ